MSDFLARTTANPPHWAREIISVWDDTLLRQHSDFLRRHYWTESGSINVFCIKGTSHPDYQGLSWSQFLHQGKHMIRNIALLESHPAYYADTAVKKPAMCFNSYNGIDWFTGADGNHRSALARFLFHEQESAYLHGLQLNHYEFDESLLTVFLALREELSLHTAHGCHVEMNVNRIHRYREDNTGWKTDTYSTSLCFSTGAWSRDCQDHPAISMIKAPRDITDPAEGWKLLVSLRMWRERREARRNDIFSWLSDRRRA